ncbi:MAG: hypothetical protein EBR67_06035 [Proteobacteria bacterium]|nr:hypothetical protein [Pseudomonadota bacterium]
MDLSIFTGSLNGLTDLQKAAFEKSLKGADVNRDKVLDKKEFTEAIKKFSETDEFKSLSAENKTLFTEKLNPDTLWAQQGASAVTNLSPEMRAHIEKFGETPTYVGKDGKVHVDREKLIQRVVDYHAGPEGGLKGFSVQGFMAAGHDERISMLQDMRKQNDAAKAAKFEEDLRLAKERDAAEAVNNNQVTAAGNPLNKVIDTLGTLAIAFIRKG